MASYLGPDTPEVLPEIDDAGFWAAARARRLVLRRCTACGSAHHPPRPLCPACQSTALDWVEAPQRGEVFSYTWSHVAGAGVAPASLPYAIALIAFPALGDLRLISNVVNATGASLAIGAPVRLIWEEDARGQPLPRFELI